MRIIFAGTPDFSVPPLQKLIESGHEVCAVYTQPDRPSGRGRKVISSPVKNLAVERNIPVFQPESLKEEKDIEDIISLDADLMVVVAYGLILPKLVLEAPKHGCINIHASILPRWRGAAPIQRAILSGDKVSGISIMQMDEGLDTGNVLLTKECEITSQTSGGNLHDKLSDLGAEAMMEILGKIENDDLAPVPQTESGVTYAEKLSKSEALIDWSSSAEAICRKVKAFDPWPVAETSFREQKVRIWDAKVSAEEPLVFSNSAKPGQIIDVQKKKVIIATGNGVLELLSVQLSGGKKLSVIDFINGKKPEKGEIFGTF